MSASGPPGHGGSPVAQAGGLLDAGQPRLAIELLERHLSTAPTDTDALVELARAHLVLDDPHTAREVARRAVGLAPDDPAVALTWARCCSMLGDHHGAATAAQRAAAVTPEDPAAHCFLAVALGNLGCLAEAHGELAVAAQVAEPTGQDQVTLEAARASVLSHRRSDRREMLRAARRAAALAPDDPMVLRMLAAKATQGKRWWLGFSAAADGMRLTPSVVENRALALFCLGRAHQRFGYQQVASTILPMVATGVVLGGAAPWVVRLTALVSLAGHAVPLLAWHRQRPMDRTILLLAWRTLRRFPGTVLLLSLQAAVVVGLLAALVLGEIRVLAPTVLASLGVAWFSVLFRGGPMRAADRALDPA